MNDHHTFTTYLDLLLAVLRDTRTAEARLLLAALDQSLERALRKTCWATSVLIPYDAERLAAEWRGDFRKLTGFLDDMMGDVSPRHQYVQRN